MGRYPLELPSSRDPRLHLAMVIVALQVLGQTVFDFPLSIPQILLPVVTCVLLEGSIIFRRRGVIAWPSSGVQAANGIGLIMRVPGTEHGDWWSFNGWWVYVLAGALAIGSKYLIRLRGRHVFNPSNFALVAIFVVLGQTVADPQVLWWGTLSVGLVAAIAVILTGSIAITRRVGQGPMAAGFWLLFAGCIGVLVASGHGMTASWAVGVVEGWRYWLILVTSPEILVFTFFMITDPRTTPPGRLGRVAFGMTVAVVASLIISTQSTEFGTKVGLLAALVLVCPLSYLMTGLTPPKHDPTDSVRSWWNGADGPGTRSSRLRKAAAGLGLLVTLSAGLMLLSSTAEGPVGDELGGEATELRTGVEFDEASVPRAVVDPAVDSASVTIDQAAAQAMAVDVAHGLVIEQQAIHEGDRRLAAAATTGVRLDQAVAQMGNPATVNSKVTLEYEWESMTVTLVRLDTGPQAPPELAVRASGVARERSEPSGELLSEAQVERTFVVRGVGGHHLITNALDERGDLIGEQSFKERPDVQVAEPTSRSATKAELGGLQFRDVTAEVGLDQPHSAEIYRAGPGVQTGGAAVADFDGDGDDDVYLTRMGLPNLLYRNDAATFVDIAGEVGVGGDPDQQSTGAIWLDIDGDGRLDLLSLGFGNHPHHLYQQYDNGFRDVSDLWGISTDSPPNEYATTYSAAAADVDRDGRVDLLIADSEPVRTSTATNMAQTPGGLPCHEEALAVHAAQPASPSRTRLLRNTGSGFEDVTSGIGTDLSMVVTFTPRFIDLNGDGWEDLVLAGDYCTSRILLNDGAGAFDDVTRQSGAATDENGMGAELFDADGDGVLDLFVTGISYPTIDGSCPVDDVAVGCTGNRLYLSNGDGTFDDATDEYGVRDGYWGWGAAAGDFNLDGRVDLMMTNGYRTTYSEGPDDGTFHDRPLYERSHDDPDRLWLNVGPGPWPEVSSEVGLTSEGTGKAAVPFDFDGDGLLDLLVVDTDGAPRLYRNETRTDNQWLSIRLRDPGSSNHYAVGATVEVDPGGDLPAIPFRVGFDGSFQSGRSTDLHVGAGMRGRVKAVRITWPDSSTQTLSDVPVGQVLEVVKGA